MAEYALNIEFMDEVEKRLELYSRKDVVEKGWLEVGKKMNFPGKFRLIYTFFFILI